MCNSGWTESSRGQSWTSSVCFPRIGFASVVVQWSPYPSQRRGSKTLQTSKLLFSLSNQCSVAENSRLKPDNLFAFDAPSFHPIYATTFLLGFFQHIIIEGRKFDSAIGLLLNTSPLSRHTGILRFWKDIRNHCVVFRSCELRWAHLRTQPWGRSVPYQCPSCFCIQAWDQQKIHGASSQLRDVSMGCSYGGKQGQREGACKECLTFMKPEEVFKVVKASEGTWVAFGVKLTEFL